MRYLLTIIFGSIVFFMNASNGQVKTKHEISEKGRQYQMNCAQATAQTELDINNVRATLLIGGDFGWDGNDAGYIVPKLEPGEPEVSSLFAGAIWMGGIDPAGNLKLAAQQYGTGSGTSDYWPGPLTSIGQTQAEACANWDRFFSVTSDDIELHLAQYQQAQQDSVDYDIDLLPTSIKEWPALGNEFFFEQSGFNLPSAEQGLAPFWDENWDGVYNPQFGDYPILDIRGCSSPVYADEMKFWIFNDAGNVHTESGGEALQMEVHAMSYAFDSADAINDMIFSQYKLIYRAAQSLNDTYLGIWLDPDLGCGEDDYVGCDTTRNMMYVYNSDAIDGSSGAACSSGVNTYADKVPYLGVDFFRGPLAPKKFGPDGEIIEPDLGEFGDTIVELGMNSFIYYNRGSNITDPVMSDPSTPNEYYNYLSGVWRNGQPMTIGGSGFGGTEVTKFAFHDEPNDANGWSMCSENLPMDDRRTIQAAGPFRLDPGSVNELIIGIPWVPDVDYPCPDLNRLYAADDLAQSLYNSCFDMLDGPDAPDMKLIAQDQKVIGLLTNDPVTSNNSQGGYSELDPLSPWNLPYDQRVYEFEGYVVYQLVDGSTSQSELNDPEKARIVFQSDRKNEVTEIFNWEARKNPNTGPFDIPYIFTPILMIEGENEGVRTSFEITKDLFLDAPLINQETYYYMAIAYGYNEWLAFDPVSQVGQTRPFIASRRNIKRYNVTPQANANQNSNYGDGAIVTRLDGKGAGSNFLSISDEERDRILEAQEGTPSEYLGTITYQEGRAPIEVKVVDPTNVVEGKYVLRFDQDENLESGNSAWELFDMESNQSIARASLQNRDEKAFLDLGFSITVGQTADAGDKTDDSNGAIGQTISYADSEKSWFTSVPDNASSLDALEFYDLHFQPTAGGEQNNDLDPRQAFTNLGTGHFAPYTLMDWRKRPELYATPAWLTAQSAVVQVRNPLQNLNNVDIVFTNDKSKWSRCVVVETGNEYFTDAGFELDDGRRNFEVVDRLSVGKEDADGDGRPDPDGTGTGFAWFPGYVIDVETGTRLNIFFGENSAFGDNAFAPGLLDAQNGSDMMFNPSSQTALAQDPNVQIIPFNLILGGMHYIYVTRDPYDECEFIYEKLTEALTFRRVDAVSLITWAGIGLGSADVPMLSYTEGLIPTETVLELRADNPYSSELGINDNASYPSYEFGFAEATTTSIFTVDRKNEQLDQIEVIPNPVLHTAKLVLKNGESLSHVNQVDVYNAAGVLQMSIQNVDNSDMQLDLYDLHSGIYFYKVFTLKGEIYTGKFVKIDR